MPKKILIVDDSSTVREQLEAILAKAGYSSLEAAHGEEALNLISQHKALALVIADVNMPIMDGIEMVKRLHETGVTPGLPVLILTTEGQPKLIEQGKKAGARGWMIKPVKPELLVATVQKLIGPP